MPKRKIGYVPPGVILDAEDVAKVTDHACYIGSRGYLMTHVRENGKRRTVTVHKLLLKAPKGLTVDHINGNPLDNRKCNLRIADRFIQAQNCRTHRDSKSGIRGVCWHKEHRKWMAYAQVNRKNKCLGYFDDIIEAANAVRRYLLKNAQGYVPRKETNHV